VISTVHDIFLKSLTNILQHVQEMLCFIVCEPSWKGRLGLDYGRESRHKSFFVHLEDSSKAIGVLDAQHARYLQIDYRLRAGDSEIREIRTSSRGCRYCELRMRPLMTSGAHIFS
jgi:hypothetical protein